MEERPPIWRVAANILNKQSRTADKRWSTSFGVGLGANNSSTQKRFTLRNVHTERTRLWTDVLVRPKIAEDRDRWRACVNSVMNVRVP